MLKPFDRLPSGPQIWYNEPDLADTDDPERIRWRAMWDRDYSTGLPSGIRMYAYPVVRKTREAAWINTNPLRPLKRWDEDKRVYEWNNDYQTLELVYDRSGSAWAKPSRAGALRSLGVRLTRWSVKVERDVKRVNAACDVAAALLSAASDHKIRLAQEDSPLGAALRNLKWQYERGAMERCDHVEAVLKEFAG